MDRFALETLLCDARYARVQCGLDCPTRAADALDRIIATLTDYTYEPQSGETFAPQLAMTPAVGTVRRWTPNVQRGQVIVDVQTERGPVTVPLTSAPRRWPSWCNWSTAADVFTMAVLGGLLAAGLTLALWL